MYAKIPKCEHKMHVFTTKMTYVRSRSSKSLPGDPKVTSESTQSDSRCSQSEPKGSQGVSKASPRHPKIVQKSSQNDLCSPFPQKSFHFPCNVRKHHYLLCFRASQETCLSMGTGSALKGRALSKKYPKSCM